MSDIYNILSKHFAGEASTEEEKLVQEFKHKNPEEYQALQSFWSKKEIELSEFNTSKAWQKVAHKAKKPRVIPLYRYLKIASSVAAVFLLISIIGINFYQSNNTPIALVTTTAQEANKEIKLADGSIVYLNANAVLHYPEQFDSKERVVSLEGEAFFEVAKDVERVFRIQTKHSLVEVLGTSFNIDTEDEQTEISVATGKVKVQSLQNSDSAILIPNQTALVKEDKLDVFSTKSPHYMAWKTGAFNFEKATISQVVEELNTYYKNQITLSKPKSDCLFSASFDQLNIEEVLEIIQLSCQLKLNKKEESYELY